MCFSSLNPLAEGENRRRKVTITAAATAYDVVQVLCPSITMVECKESHGTGTNIYHYPLALLVHRRPIAPKLPTIVLVAVVNTRWSLSPTSEGATGRRVESNRRPRC